MLIPLQPACAVQWRGLEEVLIAIVVSSLLLSSVVCCNILVAHGLCWQAYQQADQQGGHLRPGAGQPGFPAPGPPVYPGTSGPVATSGEASHDQTLMRGAEDPGDTGGESYMYLEIELHRQVSGFGFRILGGLEEDSQVSILVVSCIPIIMLMQRMSHVKINQTGLWGK